MKDHSSVLIIGGGTAGIMVAAQMLKKQPALDISIIEPADKHYYQPAWTLVGAGTYDYKKTEKSMASVMPKGVNWIKDYCTGFDAANNKVSTASSGDISYDYLVVAPGLIMDSSMIEGLEDALDRGVVCSNYTDPEHTWNVIKNFKGGNALFTQPATPIKCGGAPQKIAYMAADYFRKSGVLKKSNVIFATPGTVIFGMKNIAATLTNVLNRYGMHFRPFHAPIKVDADNGVVHFKYKKPIEEYKVKSDSPIGEKISDEGIVEIPFDMLHLAPPQRAADFIINSDLVNEANWVDVDKGTLQHNRYKNIFSLGDVAGLPTAKTGAAIRKQVPIVVENIFRLMDAKNLSQKMYDGYSSCPIVTGYGKMVLAEFDYDNRFVPDPKLKQMLIFNSDKEHWRLWILKKYILPYLYWNKMLRGDEV